MRKHMVVILNQANQASALLENHPDAKCDQHPAKMSRYFCQECHKPVCEDCVMSDCSDHVHVGLEEAAKQHRARLLQLTKLCADVKGEYQQALQKTDALKKTLVVSMENAAKKLEQKKSELKREVDIAIGKEETETRSMEKKRHKELDYIAGEFQATLNKVENVCDLGSKVTVTGSDYDVVSIYPTLSASLEELSKISKPLAADERLGTVGLKVFVSAEVKRSKVETWKEVGQFSTKPELSYPGGITVHPDGNLIAVTNGYEKQAKVFTKDGKLKHNFDGHFDVWLYDIALTPDNRFVLPGKAELLFFDGHGKRLATNAATYDMNNKPSNPGTLAVDRRGRIIAGLYGNTISIHHGDDGRVISKFATAAERRYLDITSHGDIVVSFADDTLQVIDYAGDIVRTVQRPQGVHQWNPCAVCCSRQGEIFVVNWDDKAVYRYTADGDQCLGQIIQDLHNPQGIAITEDGRQLFIAEFSHHMIKIFERQ